MALKALLTLTLAALACRQAAAIEGVLVSTLLSSALQLT